MKKMALLLLFLLLLSSCLFVQIKGFNEALQDLSDQVSHRRLRLSIGNITYQDSGIGTSLSGFLAKKLSLSLIKSGLFREFSREELDIILEEQGLSLTGLIDPETQIEPGKVMGLEGIITGDYWEEGKRIRVNLFMIDVETSRKMAATSLYLSKGDLPRGIEIRPRNYGQAVSVVKALGKEKTGSEQFQVKVWVNRGNGGLYRQGEKLRVHFKANRDCYLKLIHTDAQGKVALLFPNRYSPDNHILADRVYTIPDEDDRFDLLVTPPYGTEVIKAVASPAQFPDLAEGKQRFEEVFPVLGDYRGIAKIIERGISIVPQAERAEDICAFTTAERF